MNVIIVGLGRMGIGLARKLDRQGYNVCAIDQNPERLEELGEGYTGRKLAGVGFDRDALEQAGKRFKIKNAAKKPQEQLQMVLVEK